MPFKMEIKHEARRPRKILRVKPTKYEGTEQIHRNKRYWNNVFDELSSSDKRPMEETGFKVLAEVLPIDLCRKVCSILNIEAPPETSAPEEKTDDEGIRKSIKQPQLSKRKTINITRELDSDTDVECNSSDGEIKNNIHHEFLKKPEREQITWPTRYLEPEREDEKTLIKKADDLTDRIVNNFCDYMKQLGGDQKSQLFTPKAIKELFQIEFDTHVARSLKVVPKEMPTVEERVASVTDNPQKSHYSALGREISKDIKAERRADHLLAFSRSVTRREQWRAPRNDTKNLWRSARHVPRDLVTLKAVWEGITNIRSVKDYCRWMIEHPEYRRAPYLKSLGMFDSGVLDARLTFELQQEMTPALLSPVEVPAPIEHIRKRLSLLADTSVSLNP